MAEHRNGAGDGERQGQVKVIDRRRFTPQGEPIEATAETPATGGEPVPETDPRGDRIAEQAARIDELSRAYAALVEDNRAFRRRLEGEKDRIVAAERASVAQVLLDAADDLERALAAVTGTTEASGESLRTLVEGVRLSLGTLHKRIAELGAQRFSVVGERFDPHVAEAVDTVAVADVAQDGMVLQEVRAGYRIGDRVLRPARVRVGRLARA